LSGRTLVAGWFSFELMGATAGDAIARNVASRWLAKTGVVPDVAVTEPQLPGEVATDRLCPEDYDTVVFVCGPIGDGPPLNTFLGRFPHARKLALNVSLLQDPAEWNPFEAVIERDGADVVRPDITFAGDELAVPVVGVILVGRQEEYPTQRHDLAEHAIREALVARDVAAVSIDTRLDVNEHGLRNAAQIESAIAKMDAVLTTRLHGAALALRRGVAPVAIDSVPGGAKLRRQMLRIGWPLAFHVGDLDPSAVSEALDYALTDEARTLAAQCAARARREVDAVESEFLSALGVGPIASRR
jgi:hypothetical protein